MRILRLLYHHTKMQKGEAEQLDTLKKKIKTQQKPLKTTIEGKSGFARALTVTLPHGDVFTPVYMPVGTKGTMKGLTSQQMKDLGCKILLSNTYHLANKPGADFLDHVGGLHKFMNWDGNILTDSGGFQMVSLSKLCEIDEQGVQFENPYDQSKLKLRPQDSIHIQNKIGSDIMMALDDVIKTTTVGPRMFQAMQRTVRWADRNLSANQNKQTQNLFPIVQGGVNPQWRKTCLQQLIKKDANGYAIGGLSGGELKIDFFSTIRLCCQMLPQNKPRYLMGVGYPVDIVLGAAQGVDMFDCVFPTRTARFGNAFTSYGVLKLKNKANALNFGPLEEGCECQACKNYSVAYLHMILNQDNFCHLLSMHNISFNFNLMKKMRKAIFEDKVGQFIRTFLNNIYSKQEKIPDWVEAALKFAKIEIKLDYPFYQSNEKAINDIK